MDDAVVGRLVAMLESKIGKAVSPSRPKLRLVQEPSEREQRSEKWHWHEANLRAIEVPNVDQSPRARRIREINRIALRHGWGEAIAHAVDEAGVTSLQVMSDQEIEGLARHMRHLVECAETGCDPADAFPAR